MFFYFEKTPIALSASVATLSFSNIAVNSSSSVTFTVNSTGDTTETITLTDDSSQFDFSPATFTLVGGQSQVITANFRPTASAIKTARVTITASGGSVNSVALTGSATNYIPIAYNSALAPAVYTLQAKPALKPPTGSGAFPTGSSGWMFKNTGTGSNSYMNYYFYDASQTNSASVSQLDGAYAVVSMNANTAATSSWRPYLNIFTTRSRPYTPAEIAAGIWYDSRISYSIYTGSLAANTKYLFYFGNDPGVYPTLPRVKLGLQANAAITITSSATPNEKIYSIALMTNPNIATGSNLNKQIIVTEAVGFHALNGTGSWNEVLLQS